MQFAEVLSPEEVRSIERFIPEHTAERRALKCQVISLSKTIEAGSYEPRIAGRIFKKEIRLPKLAVGLPGRAARMHLDSEVGPTYTDSASEGTSYRFLSLNPRTSWHVPHRGGMDYRTEYHAAAPPLPIEARRAISSYQRSALVLWEAQWSEKRMALDDPAIIVPLIEDLFAVVYSWDLTAIERTALSKASV